MLLAVTILVWQPVNVALTASNMLAALPLRGVPAAAVLLARVLVASLGIAAGLSILARRGGAVALTGAALVLGTTVDLFVLSTSYLPNNLPPGDAPFHMAASVGYHAVWLVYLLRSKRVRETLIS
jgi:hypothetical protein